jgi:toxin CcdB
MAQFDVYRNTNPASRVRYPLLLDVQTDLLSGLNTRAVVPLCPASSMKGRLLGHLTPVLRVEGKPYVMVTTQLAGIAGRQLGAKVAEVAALRQDIIATLDFLITGV